MSVGAQVGSRRRAAVSFRLDRYGHLFPGHDAELRDRLDAMHAEGLQGALKGTVVELS
jgi:hypothetical protein